MRNRMNITVGALAAVVLVATLATPAAAADDAPVLIGSTGGAEASLVPGEGGYRLELARDGETEWTTDAGAAGVRFQSTGVVTSAHYSSVAHDGDQVVATADIAAPSGTSVRIEDRYSIAADTLEVDRSFAVTSLAAQDAGSGFAVTFPLRNSAPIAANDYKWFAPGTWYGNGAETFLDRNKMAFDGTETAIPVDALGAPLIANYRTDSGIDVALIDRTDGRRETIVQDKEPQNSKVLVDAAIDLPGLGIRQVTAAGTHTELFQSYPGYNKNFRNRYAGKPSIMRYLPLSEGFAGDTGFAVRVRAHDTFNDAVTGIWREAFDEMAYVNRRVDTKIHFDTLVDYVDASYGMDNGKRAYFTNYALHKPESGFLWRNTDAAWVMLAQGWARGDEGMRDRARNVINDQVTIGGLNSSNVRTIAEGHTNLMRAYLEDKKHGVDNPSWLAKVKAYADSLPAVPKHYPIEMLVLLAQETGNDTYRAKAEAAADASWEGGQKNLRFFGALEDYAGGPAEYDRESGYTALEEYMALWRSETDESKKAKWLQYAQTAAEYSETWNFVQDIAMVPKGADKSLLLYGNEHVPSYGLSSIHAGAAGGDAWQALNTVDFFELYEATGDEHFRDFAVFAEKNSMLYTNMGDKAGLMADSRANSGLGFANEYIGTAANDYWNNNQRGDGNDSNIGWLTFGLLAMTQRTLDYTGGAYSFDEPAVSDITGLDAYFRIVNKATGAALDVSGGSVQNGAPLAANPVAGDSARTQQWLFQSAGDGQFKVVNRKTSKVLNIEGSSQEPGSAAVQSIYFDDLDYRFALTPSADGWYTITNQTSGLGLEANPTVTEGTGLRVQQNVVNGSDLQLWRLEPVGDVQLLESDAGRALTADPDGAAVATSSFDGDARLDQRWSFQRADEDYVGIVNRESGLALGVDGSDVTLDQARVVDFGGYAFEQQWRITLTPAGLFTLTNRATGTSLSTGGELVEPSDGTAAFRLQTAGPATVARPATIVHAETTQVVAEAGAQPEVPTVVGVTVSDGGRTDVSVTWPELDDLDAGRHELRGTLDEDTSLQPLLVLTILPEGDLSVAGPIAVSTVAGTAPALPATVTATDTEGVEYILPVQWQVIDPTSYAEPGEFTVEGSVPGTGLAITAAVTVDTVPPQTVVGYDPVRSQTRVGVLPTLPGEVTVHYADGSSGAVPAVWDTIDPASVESVGYLQVNGDADGAPVTASVTIAAYIDRFDGAPTTQWATGGAAPWSVSGEQLTIQPLQNGQSAYAMAGDENAAPITTTGDFVLEADITMNQLGNGGLVFRAPGNNDSNGYYFGLEGHTQQFVAGKIVNGAWTEFRYANAGTAPGLPHHLRVEVVGDRISYFVDDMAKPVFAKTDSQFSAGRVGVRTWTAGMAVDNVIVRGVPEEASPLPLNPVDTTSGTAPVLPAAVDVQLTDGERRSVPVTWDGIDPDSYADEGTFTVTGRTAAGTDVTVTVNVGPSAEISSVRTALVVTRPNTEPDLPATVRVGYDDGRTADLPVEWDELPADAYASPGAYVEVTGTVSGTEESARAAVAVASFADDFSDGNANGWSTYGGAWTVDSAHRFGVTLGGFSGAGEKAVAGGTDYRDMVYESTVTVTGGNDAGMIFRVTNPGTGADAYNGYYVGIALGQKAAILGKANGSWSQLAAKTGLQVVQPGAPVTIRVIVKGKLIEVYVGDMVDPVIRYTDNAPAAPTSGALGVRGYNSSFRVTDVKAAPLAPISKIHDVEVETVEGVAPALPKDVLVDRLDGSSERVSVTWNLDGFEDGQSPVTITGSVLGTELEAHAIVTVHPAVLTSTRTVDVVTPVRAAPDLPDQVDGRYSNGDRRTLDVEDWPTISSTRYAAPTQFRVDGTLGTDVDPDGIGAHANVIVVDPNAGRGDIVGFRTVTATTVAGIAPTLPDTVIAVYENGDEEEVAVVWDPIASDQYAEPDTAFTVLGSVDGTDQRPVAEVSVTHAEGPADPVPSLTVGWPSSLLTSSKTQISYSALVTTRGAAPTGTVTVFDGSKPIASAELGTVVADGARLTARAKLTLPKLSRGVHLLWVRYSGSDEVEGSRSWPVPVLSW